MELIYVATLSRSDTSISVVVRRRHQCQRQWRRLLLSCDDGLDGLGGLGGPQRRIYISPCGVPEILPGGIRYPHCPLDGTTEAAVEAEAAATLDSSDLEKNFKSNSNERG